LQQLAELGGDLAFGEHGIEARCRGGGEVLHLHVRAKSDSPGSRKSLG
jgi:hypothetical protein